MFQGSCLGKPRSKIPLELFSLSPGPLAHVALCLVLLGNISSVQPHLGHRQGSYLVTCSFSST